MMKKQESLAMVNGVSRPFSVDSVPWMDWSEGVRFGSRVRALTDYAGGTRVGVSMEELPPGKQSVPAHYHYQEEEHLLALAGSATLRLGDERHTLKAGDYVCFPAGQTLGHCLINETNETFRYLMIGERNPTDVIVYTDSDKVKVRATGRMHRHSADLSYYDGEPTSEAIRVNPRSSS